jgi:hypothetical protein
VRVGLGEHHRDPLGDRGEADRSGDVAAATEHRGGAVASEDPPRGADRADRARDRASGLQRVRAGDALDTQRLEVVARGRHELCLGALAAGEDDARALSP